jgi:hypothetical protein
MRTVLAFVSSLGLILAAGSQAAEQIQQYTGMCDASAAIALDDRHFVVADDESNTLHVYEHGKGTAVKTVPLAKFLKTKPDKESDLEGTARIGTRIYWISSHGRNKDGELQPRRHRFFAAEMCATSPPSVVAVGVPYEKMQEHLIKAADLAAYELGKAAELAPEAKDGFNIEGLAATPDGKLLIAFRNPLPGGKAFVVPLENPDDLLTGDAAQAPRFGKPIDLNLGKRGIRSIELIGDAYYIVAGPTADEGTFALYRWPTKPGGVAASLDAELPSTFRPEVLFANTDGSSIMLLSDDGEVKVQGMNCKDLKEKPEQQSFRAVTLPLKKN